MINSKKIAILGISGSGKSVFSRQLGEKLGLPVIHMDQLFWEGNWEAVPESDYLAKHEEVIKGDQWIIEGYIDAKMSNRAQAADLILYLDYSGLRCAWQVIKRWLKHRKKAAPSFPKRPWRNWILTFCGWCSPEESVKISKRPCGK